MAIDCYYILVRASSTLGILVLSNKSFLISGFLRSNPQNWPQSILSFYPEILTRTALLKFLTLTDKILKNHFELFQVYGSYVWIICWQVIICQSLPPDKNQPIHFSSKTAFWQFREQRAHIFLPTKCPRSHCILLLLSEISFSRWELGLQWSRKMHCLTYLLTQKREEGACISCRFARFSCRFSVQVCFTSPTLFSLQK